MHNLSEESHKKLAKNKDLIGHWDIVLIVKDEKKEIISMLNDNLNTILNSKNPIQTVVKLIERYINTPEMSINFNRCKVGKVLDIQYAEDKSKLIYAVKIFGTEELLVEVCSEENLIPIVKSWSINDKLVHVKNTLANIGIDTEPIGFDGANDIDLTFNITCKPCEVLVTIPDSK